MPGVYILFMWSPDFNLFKELIVFIVLFHQENQLHRSTPPLQHRTQHRDLGPKQHRADGQCALGDAGDAEDELDDGVPDEHGLGLDPPGALGEAEEVEVHEEDARHRREEVELELGDEDPYRYYGVQTQDLEEAVGGDGHEVGFRRRDVDGHLEWFVVKNKFRIKKKTVPHHGHPQVEALLHECRAQEPCDEAQTGGQDV